MMPSVRDSRKNASTASLSVTLTYSGAAYVLEIAVLGADGRIIEPGGNGVHRARFAVLVLDHVGMETVHHAGFTLA